MVHPVPAHEAWGAPPPRIYDRPPPYPQSMGTGPVATSFSFRPPMVRAGISL